MHALKFFKDIFETGNMDVVDSLDEKIEEHILKLALYCKEKKVNQRGEDYFMMVEGRAASDQNRTMGISYIIFALEIIYNFGQWYPLDFEGEESRFKAFFKILEDKGVQYPTTASYFKPADKTKFENNYQNWKKKAQKNAP